MFKNEFQRGPAVEVFSAQGKDPVSQWKLTGVTSSNKVFDPDVKSYVYYLEGNNISTKMQLPKDSKQNLALVQRYLVLQVYITKGEDFSLDIGVYDNSNSTRKRLGLSTTYKEIHWLNLCIDLASLVSDTWKGQTYKSLESISIGGHCKLRRIFTMRGQPYDSTSDDDLYGCPSTNNNVQFDSIPRQCVLPPDLSQQTQVINMVKIRYAEGRGKEENHRSGSEIDLNASTVSRKGMSQDEYHIAFGKRVSGIAPQSRKGSGKENERSGSGKSDRRSAGKDGERRTTGREGDCNESHSSKDYHSRSKSDASDNNIPRRIPQIQKTDKLPHDSASNRKLSKSENNGHQRTRRDSDPGASQNDPDITVDKESLRSSHTWTDGADGQETIPFVKPHPPSEPSSAKHRRPVRIKSAGKERTPHSGHIKGWDSASQSSNPTPPTKSPQSGFIHNASEVQPMIMANEDEMEDILKAMQISVQRQLALEEEKLFTDSDNTSGVHEGEDSLIDVIQTLNSKKVDDDVTGGEYEESEEDNVGSQENTVYSFRSAPRQAPKVAHKLHYNPPNNSVKPHRNRIRKRVKPGSKRENDMFVSDTNKMGGGDGSHIKNKVLTKSQSDFVRNASSDEEDVLQAKHEAAQKRRSPRGKQNKKLMSSAVNNGHVLSQYSQNKQQHYTKKTSPVRDGYYLYHKNSSDEIDSSTYTKENLRSYKSAKKINTEPLQIPISAHSPHLPEVPGDPISGYDSMSSQTRKSFSKKVLREIPEQELKLRKSGGSRHYNPDMYKMGSESMEKSMLNQLRNMSDDSDEEKRSTLTATRQSVTKFRLDGSDSDETMTSTLKAPSDKDHNYLDEMQKNTFYNEDPFTMSDPRVFSPEIVLPSQKSKMNRVSPEKMYEKISHNGNNSGYSSEEELELLYDYVLELYYDPRTNLFYQLK